MHSSRTRTACSSSRLPGDLPQCMLGYTPLGVGLETPSPWVWAWRPPWPDPSTSTLGVGLETPGLTPQLPPWLWAWRPPLARPLKLLPGCGPGDLQGMLGYHHPPNCEQNSWHTLLKILPCPNFVVDKTSVSTIMPGV